MPKVLDRAQSFLDWAENGLQTVDPRRAAPIKFILALVGALLLRFIALPLATGILGVFVDVKSKGFQQLCALAGTIPSIVLLYLNWTDFGCYACDSFKNIINRQERIIYVFMVFANFAICILWAPFDLVSATVQIALMLENHLDDSEGRGDEEMHMEFAYGVFACATIEWSFYMAYCVFPANPMTGWPTGGTGCMGALLFLACAGVVARITMRPENEKINWQRWFLYAHLTGKVAYMGSLAFLSLGKFLGMVSALCMCRAWLSSFGFLLNHQKEE